MSDEPKPEKATGRELRNFASRGYEIEVISGKERLLFATSPDLPKFLVVGLSQEELEAEVPKAIDYLFGQRLEPKP
jgi:hypothetical protein